MTHLGPTPTRPPVGSHLALWLPLVFAGSMLIYLAVAFPVLGETEFYGLGLDATTPQLLAVLGGSDAGSYTTIAYDFLDGRIEDANRWILNLWPPGVPFLLWVIMLVSGGALPIVPFVVVTGVLWSAALTLLAALLIKRRAFLLMILVAAAWLGGPLLTGWTVHRGAISSDGISAALTAIVAVALLWIGEPEFDRIRGWRRQLYFGAIGLLLGMLCLFRVTWLFAILASAVALVAFLAIRALVRAVRRRRGNEARRPLGGALPWVAAVVGFAIVVGPWTVVAGRVIHPGNYSWSLGEYQWAQTWMSDEQLAANDAYFLIDGEVNWACDLDPAQCLQLETDESAKDVPYDGSGEHSFGDFQRRAVLAAAANAIPFIGARASTTFVAWMSTPGDRVGAWSNVPFGLISLLAFATALALLVRESIRGRSGAFLLLMLAGANLGMIWLSHFETRYLMPLQVIGLVVVVVVASRHEASLWRRLRRGRTAQ